MTAAPFGIAEFHDLEPELEDFSASVTEGLAAIPKTLPCKFFYDDHGSRLFDRICELEDYYPTRTEIAILAENKTAIAERMGASCHLIEFGSGSSRKIRSLLHVIENLAAYTAVDISKGHLLSAAADLAADFPDVVVNAVCADYTLPFEVSPPPSNPEAKRVGFFPGSTIGNFTPDDAVTFLSQAAALLKSGGEMLIGADLKKDPAKLVAAYNDRDGVTAAFNLNLLRRINRELGANFDLTGFRHEAIYNETEGRIEMHLYSLRDQGVRIDGVEVEFSHGESIHTENSYKYSVNDFRDICTRSGFRHIEAWTDPDDLFSIHYIQAA